MYEFAVAPAVTQIRRRGVVITEVMAESLAAELELEAGDRVLRINGRPVRDYLDFRFQTGGETELVMEVRKQSGEEWELDIERGEGEDFGLGFEQIVPRPRVFTGHQQRESRHKRQDSKDDRRRDRDSCAGGVMSRHQ